MLAVVVCSVSTSGEVDRTVHVQHVAERHLHCNKLRMET